MLIYLLRYAILVGVLMVRTTWRCRPGPRTRRKRTLSRDHDIERRRSAHHAVPLKFSNTAQRCCTSITVVVCRRVGHHSTSRFPYELSLTLTDDTKTDNFSWLPDRTHCSGLRVSVPWHNFRLFELQNTRPELRVSVPRRNF